MSERFGFGMSPFDDMFSRFFEDFERDSALSTGRSSAPGGPAGLGRREMRSLSRMPSRSRHAGMLL